MLLENCSLIRQSFLQNLSANWLILDPDHYPHFDQKNLATGLVDGKTAYNKLPAEVW